MSEDEESEEDEAEGDSGEESGGDDPANQTVIKATTNDDSLSLRAQVVSYMYNPIMLNQQ